MERSLKWKIFAAIFSSIIIIISSVLIIPTLEKTRSNTVEVVITETGLPANYTWSGTLINYVTSNGTTTRVTYGFSTSNTSYTLDIKNFQSEIFWNINSARNYEATNSSGYLQKAPDGVLRINPVFEKIYVLTFQGNNNLLNYPWDLVLYSSKSYKNINNYTNMAQPELPLENNKNSTEFKVVNGTYYYHVNSATINSTTYFPIYQNIVDVNGYAILAIKGENTSVPLSYTTHTNILNVTEKGFPPNKPGWNFSIDGGSSESYSNHAGGYYQMEFFLANGAYQYSAETINGFQASNGFGTVIMNNSDVDLVITYG